MKLFTTILTLCLGAGVHCQENPNKEFIRSEFKKFPKSIREDVNFRKAHNFFLNDEHDSILVYSHNFLASHQAKDKYSNYCHYFRGISFSDKKMHIKAREEFEKLPQLFPLDYIVMMKLGEIAIELEEYSKALQYFLDLKELPQRDLEQIKRSLLYQDIGLCYLHLGEFGTSEEYLSESLKLQENEGDTTMLIASYMNVANMYYNQYKDDLAIPLFEKAYSLSKTSGSFQVKQNASLNMAVVEEIRENYVQSIAYRKEYEQWNDSINDQNKIWEVAELEKKFISEQNQREIEILEKDNALKKAQVNSFIYSSVLLSLLAITLLYFYLSKRKINKLILSQKNELDVLNDTKDRLFSVVSHDLRSNVNAIDKNNIELSESFDTKKYQEVGQQIKQSNALTNSTKNLLDNMLNWAMLQTDQLFFQREDLNLLAIVNQVTFNFEPLLKSKNIVLKNTIKQNMFVYADLESLKIVLRNVLDNAIKFSNSNDQISIYAKVSPEKKCELIIEDTGLGMSQEVVSELLRETLKESQKVTKERTGLGLHLCQAMMLKNEGALKIESEENIGTKLIISIPLTQNHE